MDDQTSEKYDAKLTEKINLALEKLGEHFECCLILATNNLPNNQHSTFHQFSGNQHTAIGLAADFIDRNQRRKLAEAIVSAKSDQNETG